MDKEDMPAQNRMQAYKPGDSDQRPWGGYVVTGVGANAKGEEYCDKDITVNPGQILSLQSHALRREHWKVLNGTLTVILDDKVVTLQKGQDIVIPQGAIHAMANLSQSPVVVQERQEGICREEDIVRYLDAYGRSSPYTPDPRTQGSVAAYESVMKQIGGEKSSAPAAPKP
jgi:mannose-6-phosphate isomerase